MRQPGPGSLALGQEHRTQGEEPGSLALAQERHNWQEGRGSLALVHHTYLIFDKIIQNTKQRFRHIAIVLFPNNNISCAS